MMKLLIVIKYSVPNRRRSKLGDYGVRCGVRDDIRGG